MHPRRRETQVLDQCTPFYRRDRSLQVRDPLRANVVLAKHAKGLDQKPAEATRRRHVSGRRPAELDGGIADTHRPCGAVGKEHHLRWYLLAESEQVRRVRTARLQA